jgi:monofunctional biosynthetic peptidoglycan transglycosylase
LITGVFNKQSIAWAISEQILAGGGTCGFSYMPDKPDDERKKNLGRVTKLIEGNPQAAFTHPMDVTNDEHIADLMRVAKEKLGGLDFLPWVGAYLFFDPPSTLLMMQRAAEGQTIRHYPVPINRMSPYIVRSVIAAEDANFCTHDGFDIEAIQDAMESNADGGRVRGASTISQQVAKNLFLWPDRSWVRKGFETYFTALIEFMWPKRRIMEAYLNTAEWGDGNFGIEAAARARFGVPAADLTPLQAARLAAVLPSPNRWRADSPGPYVRRRAASIVERARVVRNERMASCVLIMDRPS